MKRITITSILALCMACPSFADIGKNENNPTCNDTTIGATSGTTNLEAEWTANTINLDWDPKNGGSHGSSTCSYDGGITLQSTPTAPVGYQFAGWQVKAAAFDLSTWDYDMSLSSSGYAEYFNFKQLVETNDSYTMAQFGGETDEELNNGEWSSVWVRRSDESYGKLKGVSTCSATAGNNNSWFDWYFIPSNAEGSVLPGDALTAGQYSTDTNSNLKYCWCKVTDADTGSGYQTVNSAPWVYTVMKYENVNYENRPVDVNAYECASNCTAYCSSLTDQYMSAFRSY